MKPLAFARTNGFELSMLWCRLLPNSGGNLSWQWINIEPLEIGMQIGPTSARKSDPPGKRYDNEELRGI